MYPIHWSLVILCRALVVYGLWRRVRLWRMGQPRHQRADWAAGLDVPLLAVVGQTDVLYWVGCAGSYDPHNQKVTQAMVQIFRAAGVEFAILGEEENCNAEWARRSGEEYLDQM
jgi:Fe-S oxidoreductase